MEASIYFKNQKRFDTANIVNSHIPCVSFEGNIIGFQEYDEENEKYVPLYFVDKHIVDLFNNLANGTIEYKQQLNHESHLMTAISAYITKIVHMETKIMPNGGTQIEGFTMPSGCRLFADGGLDEKLKDHIVPVEVLFTKGIMIYPTVIFISDSDEAIEKLTSDEDWMMKINSAVDA